MLLSHFLEIIKITFEFFIVFSFMYRPIFERQGCIKIPDRLLQQHHDSLNKKAARATERVPQIKLASLISLFEYSTLQYTCSSKCLFQHTPPNKGFVAMLMQLFVRCPYKDFSSILDYIYLHST